MPLATAAFFLLQRSGSHQAPPFAQPRQACCAYSKRCKSSRASRICRASTTP